MDGVADTGGGQGARADKRLRPEPYSESEDRDDGTQDVTSPGALFLKSHGHRFSPRHAVPLRSILVRHLHRQFPQPPQIELPRAQVRQRLKLDELIRPRLP